jgi:DNA (cytosine-5)-methyltransferase 1
VRLKVADRLHHIDLCSGIGGFAYAFQTVGLSRPVMFCDTDAWCRKVLAKHWPDVPITDDVKVIANDPDRFIPRTDPRKTILTAGYPCQPFSVAGKQKGTEDDRHIWPFISQIIAHKRPAFAVFENVYGHIALGLDEVLADLEAQDYATRAFIVPACGVNAPHRRDRLWIIAHTDSHGEPDGTINEKQGCGKLVAHASGGEWPAGAKKPRVLSSMQADRAVTNNISGRSENVADTDSSRQQQSHKEMAGRSSEQFDSGSFQSRENVADTDNEGSQGRLSGRQDTQGQGEHGHARCSSTVHRQSGKDKSKPVASICGMADGLPTRMDGFDGWEREPADIPRVATGIKQRAARLKGLGNAIVPQIAMNIGLTIMAMIDE